LTSRSAPAVDRGGTGKFIARRQFDRSFPMGYFAGSRPNARMSAKPAKSDPPESFEHALAELEKIVATMESGKLTLEQSLAAHKRGLELAQYCQGVLARAQQQVKVLEENTLKSLPGADDE
jgi:exodeoxyribonuclease VII small subunit